MIMKHLFTLLFLVPALWVQAQTVSIGGTSYNTVGEAIGAAQAGDVINITGVHEIGAALSIPKTFNGAITLRGTDPATDRLEGVAFDQTNEDGSVTTGVRNRLLVLYQPNSQNVHLSIENLTLKNGNSTGQGETRGGAVYVNQNFNGSLSITNCVFDGNQGNEGGAIASLGCDTTITDSTIKNSDGTNGGGMIFTNNGNNPDMMVNISRSLITGNTANNGGGIYVNGNNGSSAITLNIENTTITANSAVSGTAGAGGGAIWTKAANGSSNVGLKLVHVTIDNNSHSSAAKNGLAFAGGGSAFTKVEIYNSIIVNGDDLAQRAVNWAKAKPLNIVNSILGGSNAAGTAVDGVAANDFLDDPSFNNQKGKTATGAGLANDFICSNTGSPVIYLNDGGLAIDFCDISISDINLPSTDQIGSTRDAIPDAGAYEYGGDLSDLFILPLNLSDFETTILTDHSYEFTPLISQDLCQGNAYTIRVTKEPQHGTYTVDNNTIIYTPNTGFEGTDSFAYVANNGLDSNESTVTINVYGTPDISFVLDKSQIGEHDTAKITATLNHPGAFDIEIDLSNTSGTATTDDYNFTTDGNIFTLKSGETSATILVKGVEDGITEGDEILTITPQVTNANLISAPSFSIDILDVVTSFTLKEDMFVGFNNASFAWGDYDLDGDFDVAIMGDKGNGLETLIYRNDEVNGVRQFVDTNQNFEKIGYGTLKWVDLNKDGYIDLFVSGLSQTTGLPTSILYENKTDGLVRFFEENTTYNFPDLLETQIDFGDLDSDGDIDYIISGYNNNEQAVSFIGYQNANGFELNSTPFNPFVGGDLKIFDADSDGDNDIIASTGATQNSFLSNSQSLKKPNGFFQKLEYLIQSKNTGDELQYMTLGGNDAVSVSSSTSSLTNSSMARKNGDFTIGDFNNDGIEDVFITGENSSQVGESTLYMGSLSGGVAVYNASSEYTFPGLKNASCQWVDYDNDGDLDLFLAGLKTGEGVKTYLYKTEITNKKNVAPEKITTLSSEHLGNGNVQLSWEAPSDDFSAILGYNVRLGITPGGDELSYLLSDTETGRLLVNQTPSIFNTFYKIQLDPGVYYWSVQALDKGFKASEFSEEQTFTLTYDWKILNQGGIENKSIPARNTPILEFLDLDNDNDFDLIYGQSGNGSKVYSYNQGYLLQNNSYSFSHGIQDFEIGDINNDGSLDVIGRLGTTQNQLYMSGLNSNDVNALTNRNFNTNELFERNQKVADLNNDGTLEIINIGITSENEYFARFNMFRSNLEENQYNFTTQDISSNFSVVSQMFAPSFDIGDFDNDQDVDVIISGDLIFGENITKIFENTTVAGSNEITFVETNDNIPGVKDGSTNFIDFDSDGDLDILLSGKDNVDNDVFDLYLNTGSGTWPKVETNLPAMKETQLDMGDFNGDGLMDVLISGTTSSGKITKLLEYAVGQGFVESNYDLTDFIDAKFGFGDLDGDNDLDFVISGTNPSNNQPIFRVYLNFRSESADVIEGQSSQIQPSSRSLSVFNVQSQEIQTSYVKNQPPSIPSTPSVSYLEANSSKTIVEINWSASNDDTTPNTAISYALRLGTSPGAEDVISSGSSDNGFRKYARKGNAEHNTSWKVALEPGTYYASVQAIDASYTGSEFSQEKIYTVNHDGTLTLQKNIPGFNMIYPNPVKDYLNLKLDNNVKVVEYRILDLLGRNHKVNLNKKQENVFDVRQLQTGYYVLEINLNNGFKVRERFLKK